MATTYRASVSLVEVSSEGFAAAAPFSALLDFAAPTTTARAIAFTVTLQDGNARQTYPVPHIANKLYALAWKSSNAPVGIWVDDPTAPRARYYPGVQTNGSGVISDATNQPKAKIALLVLDPTQTVILDGAIWIEKYIVTAGSASTVDVWMLVETA